MKSKWESEKENLSKLILEDNLSYCEIGRIYGCSGTNIKKVAIFIGINVPKRNPKNSKKNIPKKQYNCLNCGKLFIPGKNTIKKFCCNECRIIFKKNERWEYYLSHQKEFEKAHSDSNLMKTYKWKFLEEQNHKCAICGISDTWNGKSITFILDHINGDSKNNLKENLRLVCPNCDSQLDTFKSKNKNSSRVYRKNYYNKK